MNKILIIINITVLTLLASCGREDFFTQFDSSASVPSGIYFNDNDPLENSLSGTISISKSSDESKITQYLLYWGSGDTTKLSGQAAIATFAADGTNHTFPLTSRPVPPGATHFLAVSASAEGEMGVYSSYRFQDLVVKMVKDIWAGASSSDPVWITEMKGKLYFFADTGDGNGIEFRSYDPATGNVANVHMANPAGNGYDAKSFSFTYNGSVYFKAKTGPGLNDYQLFRHNGTITEDISLFAPITSDPVGLYLDYINNILYFFQKDGELFSFDLTTSAKIVLTAINGNPQTFIPGKTKIVSMNNNLYFSAFHFDGTIRLYRTDGSAGNEVAVYNFNSIAAADAPGQIIVYNNNLYFGANDPSKGIGNEVWISDGTNPGTIPLSDLNPLFDIYTGVNPSNPFYFFVWNNYLYFIATDGDGNELYRTNGSVPELISEINSSSTDAFINNPPLEPRLKYFNNRVYMRANNAAGSNNELWVTDGIPSALGGDTHMVYDFFPAGNGDVFPGDDFNNKLFLRASDATGNHLWVYEPGKMPIPEKISIIPGIIPSAGVVCNNRSYFAAQGPVNGRELWVLYYK